MQKLNTAMLQSVIEEININIEYPYWTMSDGTEDLCQGRLEFAISLFHTFTRDIPNNPYIDIINEIIQKLESEEQPDEDIDFDEFLKSIQVSQCDSKENADE